MNSVMEIGEKIIFLQNGKKEWEGNNKEVFKTKNEAVGGFIYSIYFIYLLIKCLFINGCKTLN